jgi:EmrB/QacA subfamily drug resistance transporter
VGPGGRPHHQLSFGVLALGTLAYSLTTSLVIPALPVIEQELGASTTQAAWMLTAFLLSASVATPIIGRLGDIFGKKWVLVAVLGVLIAGTIICGVANSIGVLVVGRLIQGTAGGIFPLAFGIVRDEFPPIRVPLGVSLLSAMLAIGGGAGTVLAGPITDHASYHWLFWIPLIPAVLAFAAAVVVIPQSRTRAASSINWLAALLLSAWLVCLLIAFSEAPTKGWGSPMFVGLVAASIVLCTAWIRVEIRSRDPLVDMRMMRLPVVWTVNVTALLLGAAMYSAFLLIPTLVQLPESTGFGFGASVTEAGLFLFAGTVAITVFSPVAARVANRTGPRLPLIAGCAITTAALISYTLAHETAWEMYLANVFFGIGIGFAMASLGNLIVHAVPLDQTGIATGMNTIMRTVGGAIGAQVAASIVAASAGPDGLPRESGFVLAFAFCAVAGMAAVVASILVPSEGVPRHLRPLAKATAGPD